MTASARDVAAALRERLPGLPVKKLHKLLYYAQGHHVAAFDEPLFNETVSAWDMGPVVGALWYEEKHQEPAPAPAPLGEAELNTIGYVVSRYGGLTGLDLEHLTHAEDPWRLADAHRPRNGSARIEVRWLRDYFRTAATDDEDDVVFDTEALAQHLDGAEERLRQPARPDSLSEIKARLATRAS